MNSIEDQNRKQKQVRKTAQERVELKYDLAPLEGITGYAYRNAHHKFFEGTELYYSPFLCATHTRNFKSGEKQDVLPENNQGIKLVPQILSRNAEEFFWAVREMDSLGYREVNLNLGCPMPTVYRKGKGSGFLKNPDELDRFFETFFRLTEREGICCGVSVKTRLGAESFDEMPVLIDIYNRYPICKVIVHPRTGTQLYSGKADQEAFSYAYDRLKHTIVYNGDISCEEDLCRLRENFPALEEVMIGRGVIRDPALIRRLQGGGRLSVRELSAFHEELLDNYLRQLHSEVTTLKKMKELWAYMGRLFPSGEKEKKAVLKASSLAEYRGAVRVLMNIGKLQL